LISGGFQALTGAEPPWKEKKYKPPLDKFMNTPLKTMFNVKSFSNLKQSF